MTVYAVLEAQEVLEQHLHREGQAGDVAELLGSLGQRVISVALARGLEARARVEAVLAGRNHRCPSLCSGMGRYACKFGSVSALSNRAADAANATAILRPTEQSLRQDERRTLATVTERALT